VRSGLPRREQPGVPVWVHPADRPAHEQLQSVALMSVEGLLGPRLEAFRQGSARADVQPPVSTVAVLDRVPHRDE